MVSGMEMICICHITTLLWPSFQRASYMSAHFLLNLGLRSILSLFGNMFNKFNKTGAKILDSIYHMALRLL